MNREKTGEADEINMEVNFSFNFLKNIRTNLSMILTAFFVDEKCYMYFKITLYAFNSRH